MPDAQYDSSATKWGAGGPGSNKLFPFEYHADSLKDVGRGERGLLIAFLHGKEVSRAVIETDGLALVGEHTWQNEMGSKVGQIVRSNDKQGGRRDQKLRNLTNTE